jgi:acetyltransferase-like isoleucine patch superfamily enzyme
MIVALSKSYNCARCGAAVPPCCAFDRDIQDLTIWIHVRKAIKVAVQGLSLLVVLPFAAMAGFGRFSHAFHALAQLFALVPGLIGDYIRVAFYVLTLQECALRSRISFGSFFAHSSVVVSRGVYIGAYCVLGSCEIGEGTQIASHVQILSGRHQHHREADGYLQGAKEKHFSQVFIGEHCWIGAAAVIMADVGPGTTVGAGAIVTRALPAGVVAVGNPARPRTTTPCE